MTVQQLHCLSLNISTEEHLRRKSDYLAKVANPFYNYILTPSAYFIKSPRNESDREIYRTYQILPTAGKLKFRGNQDAQVRKLLTQMMKANYLTEDEFNFYTKSRDQSVPRQYCIIIGTLPTLGLATFIGYNLGTMIARRMSKVKINNNKNNNLKPFNMMRSTRRYYFFGNILFATLAGWQMSY